NSSRMNILPTNPHRKPFITDNLRPKYPRGWVSPHLSTRIFTNEPTPAAPAPEQEPAPPHDHNRSATDRPRERNCWLPAAPPVPAPGPDQPQLAPAPREHTFPTAPPRSHPY